MANFVALVGISFPAHPVSSNRSLGVGCFSERDYVGSGDALKSSSWNDGFIVLRIDPRVKEHL